MWHVGDWLVAGEDGVFENLKKSRVRELAAEITGYSRRSLSMAVRVARRYEPSMRITALSWWYHLAAARLDRSQQSDWLARAVEEGWSLAEFRSRLREAGDISQRERSRDARRVVVQLVRLNRAEIRDELLSQLREWWQREMVTEG